MSPHVFFILLFNKLEFADFGGNYSTEFRFESPISISKWNNWLDFRRKSENYFKVKVFSDSRPKSAQKLILKVFSDFWTQIICRLSKFFKIKIWGYKCAGTDCCSLVSCETKKSSFEWINRSLVSLSANLWCLVARYSVRWSLFGQFKVRS